MQAITNSELLKDKDILNEINRYIKTDVTLIRQRDSEIKEQHEQLLHVTRVGKLENLSLL